MWEKHPLYKLIETCIAACFYYTGLVSLARWWQQRSGQRVIILNYHRAAGGNLRQHLLYLNRHYRILHLEEALEGLYGTRKEGKSRHDRRTPLVITFDDGYSDNYTYGFPLAYQLKIPITIFLIPGYIGSGNSFWWMDHLIRHAQVNEVKLEEHIYHLKQQRERKALAQVIDSRINQAQSKIERKKFLISIRKALSLPSSLNARDAPTSLATWEQVKEMVASGWVLFGAHTMYHPILGTLTDPLEIQYEVNECRTILKQQLGLSIRTFAYPYGQLEDIGAAVPHAVQEAGYSWAVTTIYGYNTPQTPPHLLMRIPVDITEHWLMIAARVSGVWSFFSSLAKAPMTIMKYNHSGHTRLQDQQAEESR